MTSSARDPVALCQALIRCPSITPLDAGAQDILIEALKPLGFEVYDVTRGEVRNTFFRIGTDGPHFCFAGHTDVVPPGDETKWTHPPFSAHIDDNGVMTGRGTADMKGNVAAFVAAAAQYIQENGPPKGSLSFLITGDEEGKAVDGTEPVLRWMREHGHIPDFCLVAEPSNPEKIGEVMKIGRRGSINCIITMKGKQGHVAYPHKADNPIPRMSQLLSALTSHDLDTGSDYFPPSSLQISTVDVGNPAHNIIPGKISATFNVRFNDLWSSDKLKRHLLDLMKDYLRADDEIEWHCHGESFLTRPGQYTDMAVEAIKDITGSDPALKTDGGTSDARFVQAYCPVVEFGLVNKSIHQIDENIKVDDLKTVTSVFKRLLEKFYA